MEVCVERGWRVWEGGEEWAASWHMWWRHSFPPHVYRRLKPHQVVNHIPRANGLCRKDSLARALQKMRHVYGALYDFIPATYLLPCEYTKLVAEYTRLTYHISRTLQHVSATVSTTPTTTTTAQAIPPGTSTATPTTATTTGAGGSSNNSGTKGRPPTTDAHTPTPHNIWICKPIGSSQGRGISIFQDLHELSYASSAVAQRYIGNPLLVGGYKCDIRLYVLVTSFLPLTVYMYTEGIVRFGTEKYSLTSLDNLYSHLTNTSLNRLAPGYRKEKDRVGEGCKWTVGELRRHLRGCGRGDWLLWQRVWVLVCLTLLTQVGNVPHHHNCFELYGFDILVDEGLRPWLLEVNRCPSLTHDCHVDRMVKKPLLHHLFDLVGPPRVPEPLARPLRPPFLLLLARKHSQSPFCATLHLGRYKRLLSTGGSCEGCEVAGNTRRATVKYSNTPQNTRRRMCNSTTQAARTSGASTATPTRRQRGSGSRVCNRGMSGRDGRWPARCGDWVRIFPFNAATLHAGKDPAYLKTGVAELTKYRRACEKVYRAHSPTTPLLALDRAVRGSLWRDTVLWCPPA